MKIYASGALKKFLDMRSKGASRKELKRLAEEMRIDAEAAGADPSVEQLRQKADVEHRR